MRSNSKSELDRLEQNPSNIVRTFAQRQLSEKKEQKSGREGERK